MILTAIRSAILRTTGAVAREVFTSNEQIAVEMADLADEVATDIAKSHDWRALTRVATITGNGGQAYNLPSDYDRMTLGAEVDDGASWFWGYEPFSTVNEWARYTSGTYAIGSPGGWIIIGGALQFFPAPNGTATFPYVSNAYARDAEGNDKAEFTADTDTFVLSDRLLTLGLIWRWLDQKGMPYAEAMQTYEIALAQEQGRDKGSRLLRSGGHRFRGARLAYSGRPIA